MYLVIDLWIYLFMYLFIYSFIYSFIHLFIYFFLYLFIYLFIHLSLLLSISFFISLFLYFFIDLFLYFFICLFIYGTPHFTQQACSSPKFRLSHITGFPRRLKITWAASPEKSYFFCDHSDTIPSQFSQSRLMNVWGIYEHPDKLIYLLRSRVTFKNMGWFVEVVHF
jgi:hypothetical protein